MSRILLFIEQAENRRLLAEWLATEYDVVEGRRPADLDQEFDLCLMDRAAMEHYDDELMQRKRKERPVLLPYLLVIPERQLERYGSNVWEQMDGVVRDRVDELITTPIKKAELEGRLTNLLGSRNLSVQLREQREQYRRLLEVAPETIATVSKEGEIAYLNSRGAELFHVDTPDEVYGQSLFEYIHDEDRDSLETMVAGVDTAQEQAGFMEGRFLTNGDVRYIEVGAAPITYEQKPAVQLVIRDVTDRRRREKEVERQRDQLEKLDRLNAVIRDIDQALVKASSREEIERTVCDRLVVADRYVSAWIGNDQATSREVTPRASAGNVEEYLDSVKITVGGGTTGEGPSGKALATREPQVVQDIEADPRFEPWREAALERGYRSSIAVPLVYGETTYGALNIYASESYAFDADEQAVLTELGETIGHAINAAESKRALLTDRLNELDFHIEDSDPFLGDVSKRLGCTFTFEGMVSEPGGSYLEYFSTQCEDTDGILAMATASDHVEHVRLVGEHDDEALFEFIFTHDLIVRIFGKLGGKVQRMVVENGVHMVTVEFPYNTDIHTIVESLDATYEHVDLLAQRETERELESRQELWATFRESLTERQWSALQTAFYAGFFDWPRASTGEEVAESLGISPATFHEHLRTAQRKLLSILLTE
ncbi:PAS domain S-box-containing protein [Halogranum rubrum]|uniref:PAS domain S-box-containing protein n=1 Tax=Halogranum rubrum TaxID=553466 RepID=A0A1I4IL30_9EURY|nr:bacterio-opsin activator domain-containing protein [Halogranum rubrum]SFL54511.1 PAS domain S-box-containing protein [Halogranum rubrum]